MRINTLPIAIALAFTAGLLPSCSTGPQGTEVQYPVWSIANPLEQGFTDAGFQLPLPEGSGADWALYDAKADAWLPAQRDDLDGDGKAESLFFLADIQAGESRSFVYQPAPDGFEVEQRSQIVFKVQDRPFELETAKEVLADYTPRQQLTVPADLSPQNKWVMFEGPVWENDLIAYRFYMDDRFRTDIYGKTVQDMVMDTVGWDYHGLMDWGSDILKVGQSLGIGSPAILYQGQAFALSECAKKTIAVVASGPLRSILRVNFEGLAIDSFRLDLSCEFELQAGHHWTEVRLQSQTPLPEGMRFATGFAKHLEQVSSGRKGEVHYHYNWGQQSFHDQQLGFAIMSKESQAPVLLEGELDHLVALNASPSEASYRFISVWEKDLAQVRDSVAYRAYLEKEAALWETAFTQKAGE